MRCLPVITISLALVFFAASGAFGFSILSQDPHLDLFQNLTADPMRLVFDDTIDTATVSGATVTVTYEEDPVRVVDVAFSYETTTMTNDTLVLTPTQNDNRWPFARRLVLEVTDGVHSDTGAAFDGQIPSPVFVANIPADMDILQAWDPSDPLDFVDAFANANVLLGYNPVDPESTNINRPDTIPGMSATEAWKLTGGRPDVIIAVIDTGIEEYENEELAENFFLNQSELPVPTVDGDPCEPNIWDCNGDGRFNVRDYDLDPTFAGLGRAVNVKDLIDTFSDGYDDDQNGYPDDICGWDFLRQVNEALGVKDFPEGGHGEDRAKDAAAIAGNGNGDKPGFCPFCTILPIRISDSVMCEMNALGEGVLYAQSMGAAVAVFASGGLDYNGEVDRVLTEVSEAGMVLVGVASDELGYHHSYPGSCDDVISVKSIFPIPPIDFLGFLPMNLFAFTETYCTMWGEGVHLAASSGACSSEAAGNVSGLAGLIVSRAWDLGIDLTANEIKQLLTMSADDIARNCITLTGGGCQKGWDAHFGYGRPNAARALDMLGDPPNGVIALIPPEVKFQTPKWFTIYDPQQTPSVEVNAYMYARGRNFDWELQVGVGKEPLDKDFTVIASGSGSTPVDEAIAQMDITGLLSIDSYDRPPETSFDFTVTLRLQATYSVLGEGKIMGEDRRTVAIHRDRDTTMGLIEGFPIDLDASGEASVVLYDLDGDADHRLEVIAVTAKAQLIVYKYSEAQGGWAMMDGFPVDILDYNGLPSPVDTTLSKPAVGDLFGTGVPYIVVPTGGGALLVIHREGNGHKDARGNGSPVLDGFPVFATEPDNSSAEAYGHGRSFGASPVLGDLDGDGILEIVQASYDGHIYAWKPVDADGDGLADPVAGFPVFAKSEAGNVPADRVCPRPDERFAPQILGTPIVGVFDPDHEDPDIAEYPAIFVGTSEVCEDGLIKSARFYGIFHDGTANDSGSAFLPGFPLKVTAPLGDALPVPPVTIGITSTPAMARYNDKTYIGIGSVAWIPQLYVWNGVEMKVHNLPSHVSFNLMGHGSFGRLDDDGLHYVLPTTSAVDIIDGWISLLRPVLLAWDLDDLSQTAFAADLEDCNWYANAALADLSGDGRAEMIAGTGGFTIHAFDLDGAEPPTWPKFTNNWTVSAPTVGDMDGDGLLEVINHTREGNLFAWDTAGEACSAVGAAPQWRSFHHDEHNSGLYGKDTLPPSAVTDFQAAEIDGGYSLTFTGTGDDWQCGRPAAYDIRYAATRDALATPTLFYAASKVPAEELPTPSPAGDRVKFDTTLGESGLWFAVQTVDAAGNLSLISQPVLATENGQDDDDATDDDDDDDDDDACCG